MNTLRMVVAGAYTPTCVSVNVAPDFGSGSEWQQRGYTDADAPVVIVPVSPETQAWADFLTGYDAALRNAELSEMTTQDMEEGWWYCRQTVAAKASDADEDWLEYDYEDIRRGY